MLNCAICDNDKTVINMVKTYNDSCYMCTSCINPSKKKISILVIRWYPDRKNAENKADPTDFGNGWKKYSADAMTQIEFEPGDIIRSGKHSAIVYSFDKTNEHLIVGECWGNPQNLAARCRIAWGAFNYEWTLSTVLENMEYVFKAPKKVSVD